MKFKIVLILLVTLSGLFNFSVMSQSCNNCETLICDGINCDDGSSADGVQTSRNCSCGSEISGACAYVEFNLSLNPYFKPEDPTCKMIFRSQESGNFNLYFLQDSTCAITDCLAPDFVVSNEATFDNLPQSGILRVIICKNGGNAGRRDFTFDISCSSVENCVNLVDDDLDQWVDCDDSDCNNDSYCSYTETTSSGDGGLESNGRLSSQIAKRNYFRQKRGNFSVKKEVQPLYKGYQINLAKTEDFDIRSIVPQELMEDAEAHESTSDDLIPITNATDVFSVDLYDKDARVGSLFATESDGVYEHTKFICDRLHSATIEQVVRHTIDGLPFIVSKFRRPDGRIEFNINFSFFEKSIDHISLESHWNLSQYPVGEQYYNYQIWANNLSRLEEMVCKIMYNLNQLKEIEEVNFGEIPSVIVSSIRESNNRLEINFIEEVQLDNIEISGTMLLTEHSEEIPYFPNYRKIGESILEVDIEDIYAVGLTIRSLKDESADAIYFADGSWGLDYQPGEAFVYAFQIDESGNERSSEYKYINRNVYLEAQIETGVAVYRSLNASFNAEDVTDYNSLDFEASGRGTLEVVFVKESIDQWELQPRKIIELSGELQEIEIIIKDLEESLDDLKMIVFKIWNNESNSILTTFNLQGIKFSKEKFTTYSNDVAINIVPNPSFGNGKIVIRVDDNLAARITISDLYANEVVSQKVQLVKGSNSVFIPDGLSPGIYVVTSHHPNGKKHSTKMVIR